MKLKPYLYVCTCVYVCFYVCRYVKCVFVRLLIGLHVYMERCICMCILDVLCVYVLHCIGICILFVYVCAYGTVCRHVWVHDYGYGSVCVCLLMG